MKKIRFISMLILASLGFAACTDKFDETNENPNKIYEANPEFVFPGVVFKAVDIYTKLNHEMLQSYAQYTVNWKEQNDNENNDTYFENFYVKTLNDLEKSIRVGKTKTDFGNKLAIMQTWKAWEYFILVSTFGGVPMSDAVTEDVRDHYKYDSEAEVYNQIFDLLDAAVDSMNVNGDKFLHDPVFASSDGSSDVAGWKRFANSLRLYIGLTVQNLDRSLAEKEIRKCFADGNDKFLISSNSQNAQFVNGIDKNSDAGYMYRRVMIDIESGNQTWSSYTYPGMSHNFYIYMKSYDDPRLTVFLNTPDMKFWHLLRDDTITAPSAKWSSKGYRDSLIVQYVIPYKPRTAGKSTPAGYPVGTYTNPRNGRVESYRDPYGSITVGSRGDSNVSLEFMKADATVVLLSYADVCFMMAETAIKFPGIVSGTAQSYYEAGIQASMEQYGVAKSAVTAYMKRDGIKWNTNGSGLWEYRHFFKADIPGEGGDDAHLTQIYRQWYFADFFYGHQGWTLDRRTRCMNYPPYFYNNATPVGGNGICDWYSERLAYPQNEMYHNREGYEEAVAMLVKNSPEPNMAHDGDNFYTTLGIAAPQRTGLDWWAQGHDIEYDGAWLRHPYGYTLEDVLKNTGFTTEKELKSNMKYSSKVFSTWDPETGYMVDTKTGKLIIPEDELPAE